MICLLIMRRPYDLSLFNWQLSVFWAFAGVVSVAACVSSTNKRLRVEVSCAGSRNPSQQHHQLLTYTHFMLLCRHSECSCKRTRWHCWSVSSGM